MGHIALIIRDAIHDTKGYQRASCGRFSDWSSSSKTSKLYDYLPEEIVEVNLINTSSEEQVWQLFFDGASWTSPKENIIAGVGVILIFPHNYVISHAFSLTEPCSSNVSDHNALLIGMQLIEEIGVKKSRSVRWFKAHHQSCSWGVRSSIWRLGALSQRNHWHGREV